ncbi:UDP-galactose translocator-like [Pomacea canaliculata]|uniref:UDP-galactose translocator-like n=1 Tax=Pomacea canaliculata TaxID=400727 RepID=UPI000D72E2BF|nr:UDP-galactose translocator-like [Pomacea canaliculata]XP_025108474.1 UDP-galactose translocator-like [Pomacea canaliculata]
MGASANKMDRLEVENPPEVRRRNASGHERSGQLMKMISLLLLTPQYALLILTMRYVRTRPGAMFVTSTAVLLAELVKTLTCLLLVLVEQRSARLWALHLYENLLCQPWDFLKVCVPSLLFVVQNNLVFVAVSNLDAATFQVTYQLKILTTAVFSVMMLGKSLSRSQWLALFLLFVGVSVIQVQSAGVQSGAAMSPSAQSPVKGLAAVVVCCCLSGFANVFFEKLLKGGKQSVWMRNIQLGLSGTILGALAVWINDGSKVRVQGFFYGYDTLVWVVVAMQSLGGLLVAAVIKYADNILKGFSTAGSILLSCVASVYFFNFEMTKEFMLGTGLVLVAVYLYSSFPAVSPSVTITVSPPDHHSNKT